MVETDIQAQIKICHIIIQLTPPGGAERMLMQLLLSRPGSVQNKMVVVLTEAGLWGGSSYAPPVWKCMN